MLQKGIRNFPDTSVTFDLETERSVTCRRDSPLKRMISPDKRAEPQTFMPDIKEDTGIQFKIMDLK